MKLQYVERCFLILQEPITRRCGEKSITPKGVSISLGFDYGAENGRNCVEQAVLSATMAMKTVSGSRDACSECCSTKFRIQDLLIIKVL